MRKIVFVLGNATHAAYRIAVVGTKIFCWRWHIDLSFSAQGARSSPNYYLVVGPPWWVSFALSSRTTTRTATRPKEKEEVGFSTGTKHYKTKHCTYKGKEAEKKLFKDLDQSLWDNVGVDLSVILPNQNVSQVTRYRKRLDEVKEKVKGGQIYGGVGNASSINLLLHIQRTWRSSWASWTVFSLPPGR